MIKCAIIGFGKMGKIRAEALKEDGRAELTQVYDTNPTGVPDGVLVAGSEDEIINNPEIDAIFVCTPNFRIVPVVKASMEAGKHVFSEKPPAFTAAEMQTVIDVEQRTGRRLMYGFNHRHHESIKLAKQKIDSGEYGKILWMRGRYGKNVDESFFTGWRADAKLAGGGIFFDQGIHMLDLFLLFGGNFDDVQAFVSNVFWKLDLEDNVFAIFRNNDNGIVASLHSTMTQWRHLFSLEIFLEKGHFVLNGLKTSSGAYGEEELSVARSDLGGSHAAEMKHRFETDTSWVSEIAHFIDAIENDQPVTKGTSADALKLMKIVDAVYASDKTYHRPT